MPVGSPADGFNINTVGGTPADSYTISFVRFPIITKNKVYFFNVYDGICMSTINNDGTVNAPVKVNETFSANKVFISEHHYILDNKLYLEFMMPDQNSSNSLSYYFAILDVDPNTGVINFDTADIKEATPFDQDNYRKNALIFLNTYKYFIYSIDAHSSVYNIGYLKKLAPNDFFAQYRSTDNPYLFPQLTEKITTDDPDLPGFYKILTFVDKDEIYIYNEKSIYRLRMQDNGILTQGILQFDFVHLLTTLSYNNTPLLSSENYNVSSIKSITTHDKLYIVSMIMRDLNNDNNLHLPYVLTFDINANNELTNPTVITNLGYDVVYDHSPAFGINIQGSSTVLPIYTYDPGQNSPSQVYYNLNDPLVFVTKNHINILQPNIHINNTDSSYGLLSIPCNFGKNDYMDDYNNAQYVDYNDLNHGKPWQWQNGFNPNVLADNFYNQLLAEPTVNVTDTIVATIATKNRLFVFCEKDTPNKPKITYVKRYTLDSNGNVIGYTDIDLPMLSDIKVNDVLFNMNKIYVFGQLSHSYYSANNTYEKHAILTFDIDNDGNLTNPTQLEDGLASPFNNLYATAYSYIDSAGKIYALINKHFKNSLTSYNAAGLNIDVTHLISIYDYVNNNVVNNDSDFAQFLYIKTNDGLLMYVNYQSNDNRSLSYIEAIKVTVSRTTNEISYKSLGNCSPYINISLVTNYIVTDNFAYLIVNENDAATGLNYKAYKIDLTNPTSFTSLGEIPDNKITNSHYPVIVNNKIYFISNSGTYSTPFNGGSNNYMITTNENYIYSQTYFKLPLVESPQEFPKLRAYIKT
jgi:hypothetical protein